jgi:hypothetical protein
MVVFVFLGLCLVAVIATAYLTRNRGRSQAIAATATRQGLLYSPDDVTGLGQLRFETFDAGVGRDVLASGVTIVDVVSTRGRDDEWIRAFDYTLWVDVRLNSTGRSDGISDIAFGLDDGRDTTSDRVRQYLTSFTGAIIEVDAYLPPMQVVPESIASRVLGYVGLADLDVESDAFNSNYRVVAKDRDFAFLFLDAPIVDLLVSTECQWGLETLGRYVLIHGDRCAPGDLPRLLDLAARVRSCVPELVKERHPTAAVMQTPGWEPLHFDPLRS